MLLPPLSGYTLLYHSNKIKYSDPQNFTAEHCTTRRFHFKVRSFTVLSHNWAMCSSCLQAALTQWSLASRTRCNSTVAWRVCNFHTGSHNMRNTVFAHQRVGWGYYSRSWLKTTTQSSAKVKMSGAIPPVPYSSAWSGARIRAMENRIFYTNSILWLMKYLFDDFIKLQEQTKYFGDVIKKSPPPFMESKCSLLWSEDYATRTYPESLECSPNPQTPLF